MLDAHCRNDVNLNLGQTSVVSSSKGARFVLRLSSSTFVFVM